MRRSKKYKKRDFNRKTYGDDLRRPKNKPYKRSKDSSSNTRTKDLEDFDFSDKN